MRTWVDGGAFTSMGRIGTGEGYRFGVGDQVEGLIKNSNLDMLTWSCPLDISVEMSGR